jgi:hypothetical protein
MSIRDLLRIRGVSSPSPAATLIAHVRYLRAADNTHSQSHRGASGSSCGAVATVKSAGVLTTTVTG